MSFSPPRIQHKRKTEHVGPALEEPLPLRHAGPVPYPVPPVLHDEEGIDDEQEALLVATSSEIEFELVELSGHVVAKGAWSATFRADCLYKSALLAKPGRQCRLLQGALEIMPFTPLAALDLTLGTCIQVVWLSNSAADIFS
ncbi:unnamed protein product [Polarella glacialis]|uniref:Uncharacterized protein n=1 Tax=Polarella glacialis TaxID=89957 RepID=A0A813KS96_POLGL|nr:unnamed protein product [Polarella glacialis]